MEKNNSEIYTYFANKSIRINVNFFYFFTDIPMLYTTFEFKSLFQTINLIQHYKKNKLKKIFESCSLSLMRTNEPASDKIIIKLSTEIILSNN
jgi:hypothetical protein